MYTINTDLEGVTTISDTLTPSIEFNSIGEEYVITFTYLENVKCFNTFDYNATGINKSRYIDTTYRVSRDYKKWTNWLELNEEITNFPPVSPKDTMFLEIKFKRSGTLSTGKIILLDYTITGSSLDNVVDGLGVVVLQSSSCQECNSSSIIIKPPYIYKVFKVTDLEVISRGDTSNYTIKYRFSQDHSKTWSQWELFTKENITTVRINPIRFFQIEYLVEYTGSTFVKVYDINLIGDFQNVTLDAKKTNVYGTRDNCNSVMGGLVGDPNSNVAQAEAVNNKSNQINGCNIDNTPLGADGISKLFQPYQQQAALATLNKLGADSNQLFGHQVVYFITDADKKGIDYTFHEYQLYNYVCEDLIKVSVDNNQFPDNQITMNQFDLSLFETFEIHIPKDTFKSSFGSDRRPSKEDFLWFCEVNRMYQVEHAQQFRNFNNSALYYKIMLKKFTQKANVIAGDKTIAQKVRDLTKNSTIDELFGLENSLDKKDIANEEQIRPLTQDVLRHSILVDIVKELIENSTTIVSKSHYDMFGVDPNTPGIVYRDFRKYFQVSDNISFSCWFRINNYTVNDVYNFITYYKDGYGFKINLESDNIIITINSNTYNFKIGTLGNADALDEDVWYCYTANIDQRQRKVSQWLYKRNVTEEKDASLLGSPGLKLLHSQMDNHIPVEFEIDTNFEIMGSDMRLTNIRLFNEIIPQSEHNRILNQYILGNDYKYIIFGDNANSRITLPNYSYSQINTNIVRGEVGKLNTKKGDIESESPPMS